MKREELLAKGYSEEQVTDILNTFHSINSENEKLKGEILSKAEIEQKYNDANAKLTEIQNANMTEQEKLEAMRKEAEQNLRNSKIIVNKAKAKEILAGCNIDDDLLSSLVSDDDNATINNATKLKNSFEALTETVSKKVKEEISNLDVKPTPTNIPQGSDIMTVDKFNGMTLTEKKHWKDSNLEEYNRIFHS